MFIVRTYTNRYRGEERKKSLFCRSVWHKTHYVNLYSVVSICICMRFFCCCFVKMNQLNENKRLTCSNRLTLLHSQQRATNEREMMAQTTLVHTLVFIHIIFKWSGSKIQQQQQQQQQRNYVLLYSVFNGVLYVHTLRLFVLFSFFFLYYLFFKYPFTIYFYRYIFRLYFILFYIFFIYMYIFWLLLYDVFYSFCMRLFIVAI